MSGSNKFNRTNYCVLCRETEHKVIQDSIFIKTMN